MNKEKSFDLSNLGQDKLQELHRDNIAQLYFDGNGDTETHRRARDRVDYVVECIPVGKVLEIGCSEGVISILAAKKGCDVNGIDIHPDAIEYANNLAEKIIDEAEQRPQFKVQDVFEIESIDQEYDCVVLGEVIEHVFEPQNMLLRACLSLNVGGKFIVTTPWGLMPAPDHHQTFFLTNLLSIIPDPIKVESLDIVDDYIRLVGTKVYDPLSVVEARKECGFKSDGDLLEMTETAALQSQTFLREVINSKQIALESNWAVVKRQQGSIGEMENRIKSFQDLNNDLSARVKSLKNENLALQRAIESRRGFLEKAVRYLMNKIRS